MLDLGDLMVFTKVVETENLTRAGQQLGASYLTKPFIAAALLSKIEEATRPELSGAGW